MSRFLKGILAGALLLSASVGYVNGQVYVPVPQPGAPAVAVQPAAPQPLSTWPLVLEDPSGQIQVFQPQPEKLDGDKLSARAAVSLTPPGATEPQFGAIWLDARVATDRDTRTVTILD